MSSMVSRRPPPSGSTSQSNDRRWMSMRLGTSRDVFRRAKERRARGAATLGKTATPQGVERSGQQGGGALRGKARPSKIAQGKAAPAGGHSALTDPTRSGGVCGAAPVSEWLRLLADPRKGSASGHFAPPTRSRPIRSAFAPGPPRGPGAPSLASALRDVVTAGGEHVPGVAEVGRALAVRLAGLLVAGVEVERMAVVGHLRAGLAHGRAEQLGPHARARLRLAVRQQRRPERRTRAGAGALAVLVLHEQVERAALPVDEDGADLRLADGDGRPAVGGRAGRDRDRREDGDRGEQGEEKRSCPHRRTSGVGLRVFREDAGAPDRSVGVALGSRVGSATAAENDEGRPTRDAPRNGTTARRRELLQLDAAAGLLELGLQLLGLVALDALLDGLRRLVDERLGLLEAQAGRRADDLDDLDLLVAGGREDDVDRRADLLLGAAAVTARGGRGGRGDGRRRNAELLLERLDALGQLEHRDALELVDPLLGRSHVS